jgi:hypothetical protein
MSRPPLSARRRLVVRCSTPGCFGAVSIADPSGSPAAKSLRASRLAAAGWHIESGVGAPVCPACIDKAVKHLRGQGRDYDAPRELFGGVRKCPACGTPLDVYTTDDTGYQFVCPTGWCIAPGILIVAGCGNDGTRDSLRHQLTTYLNALAAGYRADPDWMAFLRHHLGT